MHICVIASSVPHAVPRTLAFAPHFDRVDYIDTTASASRETLENAGVRYHDPSDSEYSRIPARNLLRLLADIDPDLIVCHFCSGIHFFLAVAYGGCPVAGIVMGSDVLYERGDSHVGFMERILIRAGLRRCQAIVAKSELLAERCRSFGVTSPVSVNLWGADTTRFQPQDKTTAREKLDLPINRPIVLSPRTLSPLYNIDTIVTAIARVVTQIPDLLLVSVGRQVPEYTKSVIAQITAAGIENNVVIAGEVSQREIIDYFNAADIVVSLAQSEGFPNTVLEAMCCRKAIIVARIKQIEDVLDDNVDCVMTNIDAAALAAAMQDLLEDPARASELGKRARNKAVDIADIHRNAQRFAEHISSSANNPRRSSPGSQLIYRCLLLVYLVQKKIMRA